MRRASSHSEKWLPRFSRFSWSAGCRYGTRAHRGTWPRFVHGLAGTPLRSGRPQCLLRLVRHSRSPAGLETLCTTPRASRGMALPVSELASEVRNGGGGGCWMDARGRIRDGMCAAPQSWFGLWPEAPAALTQPRCDAAQSSTWVSDGGMGWDGRAWESL